MERRTLYSALLVALTLWVGCAAEERTPREVMAAGLGKALPDDALGRKWVPEKANGELLLGDVTATWDIPVQLSLETRLEWSDGTRRLSVREQNDFRAGLRGAFAGVRTWEGKNYEDPVRRARQEAIFVDGRLFVRENTAGFSEISDLGDPHLELRNRFVGAWASLASLVGTQMEVSNRGQTTRSGRILARIGLEQNDLAEPSSLTGPTGEAARSLPSSWPSWWEGRRVLGVLQGEVLVDPTTKRLVEGELELQYTRSDNPTDTLRVLTRFYAEPLSKQRAISFPKELAPSRDILPMVEQVLKGLDL